MMWCGQLSVAVRNRRARDARGKGRRRRWPLLHITTHYRQREQITLLLLLCLLYNLLASPDTHQHRWVGPRQYTAFIWREGCSLAKQSISPLREVIFSDGSEPSICGGNCLSRLNNLSNWRAFQFICSNIPLIKGVQFFCLFWQVYRIESFATFLKIN